MGEATASIVVLAHVHSLPSGYRGNPVQRVRMRKKARKNVAGCGTPHAYSNPARGRSQTAPGILSHPTGQIEEETGKSKEADVI